MTESRRNSKCRLHNPPHMLERRYFTIRSHNCQATGRLADYSSALYISFRYEDKKSPTTGSAWSIQE